jgi:hypothetical protein
MNTYKIADLVVQINMSENYIHPNFSDFSCNTTHPDIEWTIKTGPMPNYIQNNPTTEIGNITLCKLSDKTILHLPDMICYDIQMIVFSDNYRKAVFYLPHGYPNDKDIKEQNLEREHIFAFFREAFFCACLSFNGFSVHSASIIYNDKGYLFSGCSGTGKSTHTNMWKELFQVEILDGDVTIVRTLDHKAFIYGLPWCGTSNLYQNTRVALGGIIFLEQYSSNKIYQPTILESFERLLARSFTPMWFQELIETRIKLTEFIVESIPIYILLCLPNPESVYLIKEAIDTSNNI